MDCLQRARQGSCLQRRREQDKLSPRTRRLQQHNNYFPNNIAPEKYPNSVLGRDAAKHLAEVYKTPAEIKKYIDQLGQQSADASAVAQNQLAQGRAVGMTFSAVSKLAEQFTFEDQTGEDVVGRRQGYRLCSGPPPSRGGGLHPLSFVVGPPL